MSILSEQPSMPLSGSAEGQLCADEPGVVENGQPRSYPCPHPMTGQYVVLQTHLNDLIMVLCEVKVEGTSFF